MKSVSTFYSFTIFFFLFTAFIGCGSPKKQENHKEESVEKADLKDIKLAGLDDVKIKLADFKGKAVFLNFWATWCKPCLAEMPSIQRAIEKLEDQEIVFLAASDESVEKIEKFKTKFVFPFQFIRVLDDYANLEVYSLPTTIIYDRNGDIVVNEAGAREWDTDDMLEKLRSL